MNNQLQIYIKKTILIFVIIVMNFCLLNTQETLATENTLQEKVSDYCTKGDKIVNHYETSNDKTNSLEYLKAAKYYYYQAIRLDKSNPNGLVGLAHVALLQDKTRDAKNILMAALNFNPENPRVSFYIGETFFQEGDYTEAIDYYTWAYNHGYKHNYKTNLQLAICYEKIYETELAKRHYNEALKIKPDSNDIKKRLSNLQKAQEEIYKYSNL